MTDTPSTSLSRVRKVLEGRQLPLVVTVLALALCSPGLFSGLVVDDYLHRAALLGAPGYPELRRPAGDAYAFVRGGPQAIQRDMKRGILPWWSSPNLRLAFWRPLSGWLHWIDWHAWPNHPVLMHLHSFVWLAVATFAAAVFYRRLIRPMWVGGLAALIFAIDDARAAAAIWIADRNAISGLALGLLALLSYQSARSGRGRSGVWLTPVLFGLALLANEGSIAIAGYLAAYAAFVDTGPWLRRVTGLFPCAAVAFVWLIAYRAGGYGVHDATMYIDPIGESGRFLRAAMTHLPLLVWGQWMTPPAELSMFLSRGAVLLFAALGGGFALLLAWIIWPLLKRDPVARFFAAGMLFAIVPVCATTAQDRLLQIVGVGGAGLIALFLAGVAERADWVRSRGFGRGCSRVLAVVLVVVHLIVAPVHLALSGEQYRNLGRTMERTAATLPADEASRGKQWLVVYTPSAFFTLFSPAVRAMRGETAPERLVVLSAGIRGAEIERRDAKTLRIRMPGGFLPRPGTPAPERSAGAIEFDVSYVSQLLDLLFRRDDARFARGDTVGLGGLDIEVTRVTENGRAEEVEYRFDRPLDDGGYRWLIWNERGGYEEFTLPAIGEVRTMSPATLTRTKAGAKKAR